MQITFKLFAGLADYLPPGTRDNQVEIEVVDGSTVADLIAAHRLPDRLTHLVLVNGAYVAPSARAGHVLQSGDQLAIWPPIAGG